MRVIGLGFRTVADRVTQPRGKVARLLLLQPHDRATRLENTKSAGPFLRDPHA